MVEAFGLVPEQTPAIDLRELGVRSGTRPKASTGGFRPGEGADPLQSIAGSWVSTPAPGRKPLVEAFGLIPKQTPAINGRELGVASVWCKSGLPVINRLGRELAVCFRPGQERTPAIDRRELGPLLPKRLSRLRANSISYADGKKTSTKSPSLLSPPVAQGQSEVQASLGWRLPSHPGPPEAQVTRASRGLRCWQWQQQSSCNQIVYIQKKSFRKRKNKQIKMCSAVAAKAKCCEEKLDFRAMLMDEVVLIIEQGNLGCGSMEN
ncbi:hypothetical protein QTO34_000444 [Cnephaeus nilssonii]|uniref:Uncharacterized protein n=1 Tax=Cnephaeus nilssonii TaxID=3371016 RepID=A0AA40ICH1_CNENI|nr:hypothetical protein QTO34_000444 [Eptesicus nilssonii]